MTTSQLTEKETTALEALRRNIETEDYPSQGWGLVYLDNAIPSGWSIYTWRTMLSKLSSKGLYKVEDGYAWGCVLIG